MARRTKYTPAVAERICQAIRLGATFDLAAKAGGISHETFRVWRQANAAFSAQVEKAEATAALAWLAMIEQAAKEGIWTAAAWKLERRYPHQYGRQVIEHQVRQLREETARIAAEEGLDADRLWETTQAVAARLN